MELEGLASRPAGLTQGTVSTCSVFAGSILGSEGPGMNPNMSRRACEGHPSHASDQAETAVGYFKPFTAVASLVELGDVALLGVPPPSFSSPSSSLQEVQLW